MGECFVIMPFREPFNNYYKTIFVPAIKRSGLIPVRADEIYGVSPIIEDIAQGIINSEIIIADVTKRNPNVNYELGMAHALGKQVIIISQSTEDIPFDYRHFRAIIYQPRGAKWKAKLEDNICATIDKVLSDKGSHYILNSIAKFMGANPNLEEWGMISIFGSRQEMNIRCNQLNKELKHNLDIAAFGLKSWRDSQTSVIKKKLKEGLVVRILSPQYDSIHVKQREKDEKVTRNGIRKSIIDLRTWVIDMKKHCDKGGAIDLKFYDSLPLDFHWHQENNLFVGPYLYGKGSQQTPTYEFVIGGKGYEFFSEYFEDMWKNKKVFHEAI